LRQRGPSEFFLWGIGQQEQNNKGFGRLNTRTVPNFVLPVCVQSANHALSAPSFSFQPLSQLLQLHLVRIREKGGIFELVCRCHSETRFGEQEITQSNTSMSWASFCIAILVASGGVGRGIVKLITLVK
jgi:hypothetical protein